MAPSLMTEQEVEHLLWRHKIDVQLEELMNLTWEEKMKRASNRWDEKRNAILKILGIKKIIQEAIAEEKSNSDMPSASINSQDEHDFPESNILGGPSKVEENEDGVFDKIPVQNSNCDYHQQGRTSNLMAEKPFGSIQGVQFTSFEIDSLKLGVEVYQQREEIRSQDSVNTSTMVGEFEEISTIEDRVLKRKIGGINFSMMSNDSGLEEHYSISHFSLRIQKRTKPNIQMEAIDAVDDCPFFLFPTSPIRYLFPVSLISFSQFSLYSLFFYFTHSGFDNSMGVVNKNVNTSWPVKASGFKGGTQQTPTSSMFHSQAIIYSGKKRTDFA